MENPLLWAFGSFPTLVAFTIVITGWITTKAGLKDWPARGVSWGIGFVFAFIGHFGDFGYFADKAVFDTIIEGLGVGLVANGVWTIPKVKTVLEKIGAN